MSVHKGACDGCLLTLLSRICGCRFLPRNPRGYLLRGILTFGLDLDSGCLIEELLGQVRYVKLCPTTVYVVAIYLTIVVLKVTQKLFYVVFFVESE